MKRDAKYDESKKLGKRILLVIAAILLLAAGIGIGMNIGKKNREEAATGSLMTEDPNAAPIGEEQESNNDEVKKGIEIPGYPSLYISAGSTDANVMLSNPEGNPCYFVYELILSDTGESLYRSGLIPPGEAVSGITLNRSLSAGEYQAVLSVSTYSLEDGTTPMNGAEMETVLEVS